MEENLSSLNTMMDAGDSASLDDTQELQDLVSDEYPGVVTSGNKNW
jgi:hypothetical protein